MTEVFDIIRTEGPDAGLPEVVIAIRDMLNEAYRLDPSAIFELLTHPTLCLDELGVQHPDIICEPAPPYIPNGRGSVNPLGLINGLLHRLGGASFQYLIEQDRGLEVTPHGTRALVGFKITSYNATFDPDDWEFEQSSGYAGYRNRKTGEWAYQAWYTRKMEELAFHKKEKQAGP